ncbi:MAG: hypothetical protein IPO19_15600 [Rhodoferax sp.]|jgi:hypothetical protein|nr:hypothetical protein [Rhodoferax sp.]MBK9237323.1 hypothetical protein [Rhodoferax sp.]
MLTVVNVLVVALVIIGAFALSSSGARTRHTRQPDEATTPASAKVAHTPNTQQV